jgi:predicted nucleic acid-binding protein
VIVADTGAVIALLDRSEKHHAVLRDLYDHDPDGWVLPWTILPEVDYLLATHLGTKAQDAFLADLADGAFLVAWGSDDDLAAADRIHRKYHALKIGLVDAAVIAVAERLKANAIATLDLRHFAAVAIAGRPRLLPRDA